jgi:endonuclease/exonuclease/phosphatase family metal-dependent hydrolase
MKIISLNVETDLHLERIIPFLEREKPDVICLQEVYGHMVVQFEQLGYRTYFLPMTQMVESERIATFGVLIGTLLPSRMHETFYYTDKTGSDKIPLYDVTDKPHTTKQGVIALEVTHGTETYVIATTHFTWTADGANPCPEQIADMDAFLRATEHLPPHIMCGDFNIPRHQNYLYTHLIKQYHDTVPLKYTTSLDMSVHRLGAIPEKRALLNSYMVDYLFTQPPYGATDVRLEFGVSDHVAIVANVSKIRE